MKIFFDHQTFSTQNYGGISRYFTELITGINRTRHQAYLSVFRSNNAYLKEYGLPVKPFLPSVRFPGKRQALYAINQVYSRLDLRRSRFDLFHPTDYDPYFLKGLGRRPFVLTIHDMILEKYGHRYPVELQDHQLITARKKQLAQRAARIITVSENTKRDVIDLFGIGPERIQVIHLGSSFPAPEGEPDVLPAAPEDPYLLFVGNRGHYKNFNFFLEAVTPVLLQYRLRLICAGGGSFNPDEKSLMAKLGVDDLVVQQPINDSVLRSLYRHALAFVFPTLYEGFGIPVLEAFACDCPCIVSRSGSLPEVAGEAARFIDPQDPESVRRTVELVLTDEAIRREMVQKGRQRLPLFSWSKTIRETVELYESI